MKKVFITGGAGFIGTNLIREMGTGFQFCIFDNLNPQIHGSDPILSFPANVSLVRGDIRDRSLLCEVLASYHPEYVFHLAAETGTGQSQDEIARYCEVNVTGTANLIEAIRLSHAPVKQIVLPSSRAVYGEGPWQSSSGQIVHPLMRSLSELNAGKFIPKSPLDQSELKIPIAAQESMAPQPASIYASTKLMQEYLLIQSSPLATWNHTILRLQNVYGAGQSLKNPYTGVLSIFCGQIQRGEQLNVYEDGEIFRDFVYVSDVARALALSLDNKNSYGQIINVGSGRPRSILEVTKILAKQFENYSLEPKISGQFRVGDIRAAFADISKARRVLNWQPEVSLELGLEKLVNWVLEAN